MQTWYTIDDGQHSLKAGGDKWEVIDPWASLAGNTFACSFSLLVFPFWSLSGMEEALHICTCALSVGPGIGISDQLTLDLSLNLAWKRSRCLMPPRARQRGRRLWEMGWRRNVWPWVTSVFFWDEQLLLVPFWLSSLHNDDPQVNKSAITDMTEMIPAFQAVKWAITLLRATEVHKAKGASCLHVLLLSLLSSMLKAVILLPVWCKLFLGIHLFKLKKKKNPFRYYSLP